MSEFVQPDVTEPTLSAILANPADRSRGDQRLAVAAFDHYVAGQPRGPAKPGGVN
jgi:hypothetical protein